MIIAGYCRECCPALRKDFILKNDSSGCALEVYYPNGLSGRWKRRKQTTVERCDKETRDRTNLSWSFRHGPSSAPRITRAAPVRRVWKGDKTVMGVSRSFNTALIEC